MVFSSIIFFDQVEVFGQLLETFFALQKPKMAVQPYNRVGVGDAIKG